MKRNKVQINIEEVFFFFNETSQKTDEKNNIVDVNIKFDLYLNRSMYY